MNESKGPFRKVGALYLRSSQHQTSGFRSLCNVNNGVPYELATFYCLVGLNRFAQREACGNDWPQGTRFQGRIDIVNALLSRAIGKKVDQNEANGDVLAEQFVERKWWIGVSVRAIGRDHPIGLDYADIKCHVLTKGHIHNPIHTITRCDLTNTSCDIFTSIVKDIISSCGLSHRCLLRRTYRRNHGCPSPLRQLDCCIANGSRAACNQDGLTTHRPISKKTAMGRQRRNAQARSRLKINSVRKMHCLRAWEHDVLGSGPQRPPELSIPEPDALTYP